jgi:hypothetical protein
MIKAEFIKFFENLPSEFRTYRGEFDFDCEYKTGSGYVKDVIKCIDGFTFSVQNHGFSYSSKSDGQDDYDTLEVGFPSEIEETLKPYEYLDENIYRYVPIQIILDIINKHGGIVSY